MASETASKPDSSIAPQNRSKRRLLFACLAIAAAIGLVAFTLQFSGGRIVEPYFQQRPLACLYQESVDQGFRPYYFCEDPERFARTFRKRQSVPLILKETPSDRRMVGLSYVGGLSRDTTAMLAYVEEQPIVVFVDRKEFDDPSLMSQKTTDSPMLRVHRRELGDLVIYEVSPFDVEKMSPYLAIGE